MVIITIFSYNRISEATASQGLLAPEGFSVVFLIWNNSNYEKGEGEGGGWGREAYLVVDMMHSRGQRPNVHQCQNNYDEEE